MKCLIQIFIIAISIFLCSSCASKTSAVSESKIQNNVSVKDACREWQRRYEVLSENQKASFQTEEIYSDDSYLLSESLVSDCALRIEIGDFLRKVIAGTNDENDKNFASINSKEIVKVIENIWNSENFSVDGVSHEKYLLLLKETGIKDEDIAPFIARLIREEKLNSEAEDEIFYILLNRPLPNLNSDISASLKKSEQEKDFLGQIYAAYLLFRDTSERKYFEMLKSVSKNEKLSGAERTELKKIIGKIERKVAVDYEDFDRLSYAVEKKKPLVYN